MSALFFMMPELLAMPLEQLAPGKCEMLSSRANMLDVVLELIDRAPFAALNGVIRACQATSRRSVDRSKYVESATYTRDRAVVVVHRYPNGVRTHSSVIYDNRAPWTISYVDDRPCCLSGAGVVVDIDHGIYVMPDAESPFVHRISVVGRHEDDFGDALISQKFIDDIVTWVRNGTPPQASAAAYLATCKKYGILNTAAWLDMGQIGVSELVM